ncbi:Uncharacterised protein [Candidatus Burarchaeum australiense]|nr:Uncharacterised protein [Candidatus Burarchaeum australiense]
MHLACPCRFLDELGRNALRLVERKQIFLVHPALLHDVGHDAPRPVGRFLVVLFLDFEHARDCFVVLLQLREERLQVIAVQLHRLGEREVELVLAHVGERAPENHAQVVAASDIARQPAVGYCECKCARVVEHRVERLERRNLARQVLGRCADLPRNPLPHCLEVRVLLQVNLAAYGRELCHQFFINLYAASFQQLVPRRAEAAVVGSGRAARIPHQPFEPPADVNHFRVELLVSLAGLGELHEHGVDEFEAAREAFDARAEGAEVWHCPDILHISQILGLYAEHTRQIAIVQIKALVLPVRALFLRVIEGMLARHHEAGEVPAGHAHVGQVVEPEAHLRDYERGGRIFENNLALLDAHEVDYRGYREIQIIAPAADCRVARYLLVPVLLEIGGELLPSLAVVGALALAEEGVWLAGAVSAGVLLDAPEGAAALHALAPAEALLLEHFDLVVLGIIAPELGLEGLFCKHHCHQRGLSGIKTLNHL